MRPLSCDDVLVARVQSAAKAAELLVVLGQKAAGEETKGAACEILEREPDTNLQSQDLARATVVWKNAKRMIDREKRACASAPASMIILWSSDNVIIRYE